MKVKTGQPFVEGLPCDRNLRRYHDIGRLSSEADLLSRGRVVRVLQEPTAMDYHYDQRSAAVIFALILWKAIDWSRGNSSKTTEGFSTSRPSPLFRMRVSGLRSGFESEELEGNQCGKKYKVMCRCDGKKRVRTWKWKQENCLLS